MTKKWGELACPKCKKFMRADALKCPYCQTEFTAAEAVVRKQHNDHQNRAALKGCLVLVVIAVAAWWLFFSGGDDKPARPADFADRQKAVAQQKPEGPLNRNDLEGVVAKAKRIYDTEGAACEAAYATQLNDDTISAVEIGHNEIKKWGRYDFSRITKVGVIESALKSCETATAAFDTLPVTGVEKIDPARTECSARYGHMASLLGQFRELIANNGNDEIYPLLLDTWSYDEENYHNLKEEWHAECRMAILALPTR